MTNTYNAAYILFTVRCTGGQSVYSHCAFKLLHDDKPQTCPTMLLASV